jgi:hypothetical protein
MIPVVVHVVGSPLLVSIFGKDQSAVFVLSGSLISDTVPTGGLGGIKLIFDLRRRCRSLLRLLCILQAEHY